MQAIAVLLLETSYQKRDTGKTTPEIIEAIKKMFEWLRVMEDNDPVAAKAYRVVHRILKAVAPILQSTADELLSLHQDSNAPSGDLPHWHTENISLTSSGEALPSYGHVENVPSSADAPFRLQSYQLQVSETMPDLSSNAGFNPNDAMHLPHSDAPNPLYDTGGYTSEYYDDQIPIGNPFFTELDQDAPFANLQDTWVGPMAPNAFDPHWPDLSNVS